MWSNQDKQICREMGISVTPRDEWPAGTVGDGLRHRLADHASYEADRAAYWQVRYHHAKRDMDAMRKQCIVAWTCWLVTVLAYVAMRG